MSLWSRIRNTLSPASYESGIREELDFHLEMDRRNGHDAREARIRLGNPTRIEEQVRDVRIATWLESWLLDLRLGARMLIKYPGLALAGGVGMAVAVALAAGGYGVMTNDFLSPHLPFPNSDRLVSIELWDSAGRVPERRILHDYQSWRDNLKSFEWIAAFRTLHSNLIAPGARPESVRVAAMTASGFQVAGVQPLMGRFLKPEDERAGSPSVIVIGESVWRNRFAGDPGILGRTVQLGATRHEIVGVMPEGFAFPVNDRFWVPLRAAALPADSLTGPDLMVFGRLAPGATIESAQAELTAAIARAALELPRTYARLQPRVTPYPLAFVGMSGPDDTTAALSPQALFISLMVLVCLNVAILVYARTATRNEELGLRTALGAGRRRIVGQLFLEAFVLSFLAALGGIAIAALALRQVASATLSLAADLPFWISFRLSPATILYAVALSVLAAAIIGIVPALQATRRRLQGFRLRGAGGMRLGKTWTILIVAQVTCAVALLPPAVSGAWNDLQDGIAGTGFAAQRFLSAELSMDAGRFADRQTELLRRVEADPQVSGVTFSLTIPGDERDARIEAEAGSGPVETKFNRVDLNFFEVFHVPSLAGRGFESGDDAPEASAVIVNQPLAQALFGGNALGRRIRYTTGGPAPLNGEPGRWYRIVGIVRDFPTGVSPGMRGTNLKLYHAAAPGQLNPAMLAIRMRGGAPGAFASRLVDIGQSVDPGLNLRKIRGLDEALRSEQWISRLTAAVFIAITLSVLILSSAGIYALMSFTVSQRRKEIGIRMALGADWKRIVGGIFSRALMQLAAGAALGLALAIVAQHASGGVLIGENANIVLPLVTLTVVAVGLLAALGPARRSLRIDPREALSEE
jgi:predicted permease